MESILERPTPGLVHINGMDNFLHVGLGAGIPASGLWAASRA